MNALLDSLTANPLAAAVVVGAAASLAGAGRRGMVAAVGVLIVLVRAHRSRRTGRRDQALAAIPAQCRPWREGGYGLPRAVSEAEYEAGRLRLAAALEHRSEGEQ